MACTIPDIPKYLHYEDGKRKIFKESDFKRKYPLYRTGNSENENPINFPHTFTSISLSWDKLILLEDVLPILKAMNPKSQDNYVYYGYADEIKKYVLEEECIIDGTYKGKHVLKTIIKHTPEPCNYSHSEILIQHSYYENKELQTVVLEHGNWNQSLFKKVKSQQKSFFRQMELRYRAEMSLLLKYDSKKLTIPLYLRIIPKNLIIKAWFKYIMLICK